MTAADTTAADLAAHPWLTEFQYPLSGQCWCNICPQGHAGGHDGGVSVPSFGSVLVQPLYALFFVDRDGVSVPSFGSVLVQPFITSVSPPRSGVSVPSFGSVLVQPRTE